MVLSSLHDFKSSISRWRRTFHKAPELDLGCDETADFIIKRLKEFGIDCVEFGVAETGVIATIEGRASGPVTALRADMDALPILETSGVGWASQKPGIMHACGHDGHMAMLLGAAKYLCETRAFPGKVVLIFQPGEEMSGGGRIMVEEGVLDRFGVEQIFALHVMPNQPFGTLFTRPGPLLAAVDDFEVTIHGQGGHAATPALCHNPIDDIPAVLGAIQDLKHDLALTADTGVLSTTVVQSGDATNVIPSSVALKGTLRCLDDALRDRAERAFVDLASLNEDAYTLSTNYHRYYPPLVNDPVQTQYAVDVARSLLGADKVNAQTPPRLFSEDFSYMLNAKPGCFLLLGQGDGPGLHDPDFDFNDEIAPIGAAFLAKLVESQGAV